MADASEGGAEEEKEGHSGAIMLAGIRAPTTASLSGGRGLVSHLPHAGQWQERAGTGEGRPSFHRTHGKEFRKNTEHYHKGLTAWKLRVTPALTYPNA